MNLDNDFLHFLTIFQKWLFYFTFNLNSTDELRVTLQENEKEGSSLLALNVPEIQIDNTDFDSDNIEDLQEEWELEDCEDLEYEFYEQEISKLWFNWQKYKFNNVQFHILFVAVVKCMLAMIHVK